MAAEPGGAEPVPRADTLNSRAELLLCPPPPASRSRVDQAGPGHGEEEVRCPGSISLGPEGSQQGARRRLAEPGSQVQLSSILTFTTFLHPESCRLPARLQCFQLMGSHAYLTTGLVQGLLAR